MKHLRNTLLIFFALTVGFSLRAQPVRITDLNPSADHTFPDEGIRMVVMGNHLYFVADDGVHGAELWVSDGTANGTKLLKDIKSGSGSGSISSLLIFNGKLYFSANDGIAGAELWVSDGTEAGTQLLTDLRAGSASASPRGFRIVGNVIYFAADKSINSTTLWKTDGTEAGTVEVVSSLISALSPSQLTALGDKLYFVGPGSELWTTDGTDSGTVMVKEIAPGTTGPFITNMVALNGKLYFQAEDETLNDEPWVSDGTEAGTMKLKEISPGIEGSYPWKFHLFKGQVYFAAANKIWRTDGTPAGTALFKNITVFPANNDPAYFISDANYLYFPADDGVNGVELWRSDGTPEGTVMLKNINNNFFSSEPKSFAWGSDGLLYFTAALSGFGEELWKSDGTEAGTAIVADLYTGPGHAAPQSLKLLNGTLYFVANDGIHGRELWKLDLTTAVKDPAWSKDLFSIAPNPAGDVLHLTFPQHVSDDNCTVRLLSLSGQPLYTVAHSPAAAHYLDVPTTQLPDGLYLLEVVSGHRAQVEKVVIQR